MSQKEGRQDEYDLIVEDDVNINEMLKEALEKEGYRCRTGIFRDRREICAFAGTALDLVLLDLMLPGMSGEALLKEIRGKRGHSGYCSFCKR